MKRLMIALIAVVALYGCKGVSYDIKGMAVNMPGEVTLIASHDVADTLATCEVVYDTGYFEFKGKVDEPMSAYVCDPDGVPIVLVFIEEGEIKINLNEDQNAYEATGSPSNDGFKEANMRIWDFQMSYNNLAHEGASDEQIGEVLEQYNEYILSVVEENPDKLLGLYFFTMACENMSAAEIREGISKFTPKMRNTAMMRQIEQRVEMVERTEVGASYSEIVAKDTEDQEVALSSLVGEGKWVLLDFWATWCSPCREEIPHLAKAYKKYADKGFEIYGVSLDNDVNAWKLFVKDNLMTWVNVYGLNEKKESELAILYNVRSIPTNYLISPEGKIVAKNLRGEEVVAKLAELLGE